MSEVLRVENLSKSFSFQKLEGLESVKTKKNLITYAVFSSKTAFFISFFVGEAKK